MRKPRGFTLVEVLAALVLTALLMVAVLHVTVSLGRTRAAMTRRLPSAVPPLSGSASIPDTAFPTAPPVASETPDAPQDERLIEMIRWDLAHTRSVQVDANQVELVGYASLDPQTLEPVHLPARVTYRLSAAPPGSPGSPGTAGTSGTTGTLKTPGPTAKPRPTSGEVARVLTREQVLLQGVLTAERGTARVWVAPVARGVRAFTLTAVPSAAAGAEEERGRRSRDNTGSPPQPPPPLRGALPASVHLTLAWDQPGRPGINLVVVTR